MDDEFKFDVRVVERLIQKGVVTREEYEKHLASLPDLSDSVETFNVDDGEEKAPKKDS